MIENLITFLRAHFPYFPTWWIFIPLSLILLFLAAWLYWRIRLVIAQRSKKFLAVIRILIILLILFCICDPITRHFKSHKLENLVAIVIDNSKSMTIPDEEGKLTRLEKAKRNIFGPEYDMLSPLSQKFRLRKFSFSDDADELTKDNPLTGEGKRTNLSRSLTSVLSTLSHETLSGVILFSDGADNTQASLSPVIQAYRESGVPIYAVPVGKDRAMKDVEIDQISTHKKVTVDAIVDIEVKIKSEGMNGEKVTVQLKRGEGAIKEEEVTLKGGIQRLKMQFIPEEEGLLRYKVVILPRKDELLKENNEESFVVHAARHQIKVLYMEGTQYRITTRKKWEFQYIVEALEEDKNIKVTPMFRDDFLAARQAGVPRVQDPEKGFPRDKKKLYEYDVIISSDIDIDYFTEQQLKNIVDFVSEHGGGFIMIGGYTAFGPGGYDESIIDKLLPVDMEEGRNDKYTEGNQFQWEITPDGWTHPIMQLDPDPKKNREIWKRMPTFNGYNRVQRAKPAAITLAVHPYERSLYGENTKRVILAVQQYGKGRSIAMCTDSTAGWGERFEEWGDGTINEETYEKDNKYFRKFWQNAIRWVATYQYKVPNSTILLHSEINKYAIGDEALITAEVYNENYDRTNQAKVKVTIKKPDQTTVEREMKPDFSKTGEYFLSEKIDQPGEYEVVAKSFMNDANSIQDEKNKGLREIGRDILFFYASEPNFEFKNYQLNEELLKKISQGTGGRYIPMEQLPELVSDLAKETHEEQSYIERAFWDNIYLYVIILALLAAEWIWRRRAGLP